MTTIFCIAVSVSVAALVLGIVLGKASKDEPLHKTPLEDHETFWHK